MMDYKLQDEIISKVYISIAIWMVLFSIAVFGFRFLSVSMPLLKTIPDNGYSESLLLLTSRGISTINITKFDYLVLN